jgi:hypothetical protein
LIEALVKHKIDSELGLDPIRGKGTGLIILLHGFVRSKTIVEYNG